MKKVDEQTYTLKEVRENLDKYLDFSANRLRVRLKNTDTYNKDKIGVKTEKGALGN